MKTKLLTVLVSGACAFFALPAQAAVGYCNTFQPATTDADLSVDDMTLNGVEATNCYGVADGNDNLTAVNALKWGDDFDFLTKAERPGNSDGGSSSGTYLDFLTFNLAWVGGDKGSWTVNVTDGNGDTDPNLPVWIDLVAALKGANGYGLWFFDDIKVDLSNSGAWTLDFTAPNGKIGPDLSHLSLYIRAGEEGGDGPAEVPEPASLALLGLGLAGLGLMRRRRV